MPLWSNDLWAALDERLTTPTITPVGMPAWLKGDAPVLLEALAGLLETLAEQTGLAEFDGELCLGNHRVYLDICWQGETLPHRRLEDWRHRRLERSLIPPVSRMYCASMPVMSGAFPTVTGQGCACPCRRCPGPERLARPFHHARNFTISISPTCRPRISNAPTTPCMNSRSLLSTPRPPAWPCARETDSSVSAPAVSSMAGSWPTRPSSSTSIPAGRFRRPAPPSMA